MHTMKTLTSALFVAAFFLFTSFAGAEDVTKTKVVLIAGAPSHPSGQHEFNAGAIILARALNEESGLPIEVKVVHNGWPEDSSVFADAKAIVIYSDGNAKHPAQGHEDELDKMLEKGVGLMCMHYAVEVPAGPLGEKFKTWLGGHYESGYSTNPHWTAKVTPKTGHPVGHGVPGFAANDEWYYNIRFAEPKKADDILTATPTRKNINRYIHWTPAGEKGLNSKQTLMWAVQRPDGGRAVGFTGGHWHRNWALDDFRQLVLNGIVWTAGIEVPKEGVVSKAVTEAQLNENLDKKKTVEHVKLPSEDDLNQPAAEIIKYRWPGHNPK